MLDSIRREVLDPRRLAAARRSMLLDTGAEEPFDRLSRLAALLLDAPLAFVTVVDESRSFWKSCIGVDATEIADRQNPVEESFCQYVVASREGFLIDDAASDPRTRDNPSVEGMGVRAWAGFPLWSADGFVLGSFCVVDTRPRAWTDRDAEILRSLAGAAGGEVKLRGAAEDSRRLASSLQDALLPPQLPSLPGCEVAAAYRPAGAGVDVGGDFYDLFEGPDGGWHAIIGDVCGKGVQAAKVTSLARWVLRGAAAQGATPAEALGVLNSELLRSPGKGDLLTALYLQLHSHADGLHVAVAAAGHPPPLIQRHDGEIEVVAAHGDLLGAFDELQHSDAAVVLRPGDTAVAFTDGLLEARRGREEFGLERVRAELHRGDSAAQTCAAIDDALVRWNGDAPPRDDAAILVLRAR